MCQCNIVIHVKLKDRIRGRSGMEDTDRRAQFTKWSAEGHRLRHENSNISSK
jgi:hypothetical protein